MDTVLLLHANSASHKGCKLVCCSHYWCISVIASQLCYEFGKYYASHYSFPSSLRLWHHQRSPKRSLLCVGSMEGDSCFELEINEWRRFVSQCRICDESSLFCKSADCDNVFLASNYEEDKTTFESKINKDNAMIRFEFLEALVRLSISKYVKIGATGSVAEAVGILMGHDIEPNLEVEARIDPNDFRRDRLYNEVMHDTLNNHMALLQVNMARPCHNAFCFTTKEITI